MRLRYLPVTADFFIDLCKGGEFHVACQNPLPQDARIIRMGHDMFGQLELVIESQEFGDVEEGDEIPRQPKPLFNRLDVPKISLDKQ